MTLCIEFILYSFLFYIFLSYLLLCFRAQGVYSILSYTPSYTAVQWKSYLCYIIQTGYWKIYLLFSMFAMSWQGWWLITNTLSSIGAILKITASDSLLVWSSLDTILSLLFNHKTTTKTTLLQFFYILCDGMIWV